MATTFEVVQADLAFEAGFQQPDFGLLRDPPELLGHFYRRLASQGLRLNDIRIEGDKGTAADCHVLLHLFNYGITVRVRLDKVEVVWTSLVRERVQQFTAATTDVLRAITDYKPETTFTTFAVAVGLHGKLQGIQARDFLTHFTSNAPKDLGPQTGTAAAFYFGPDGDRLVSTVTVDVSAVVAEGLFTRLYGVWDARRVSADAIEKVADAFFRKALESLGVQVLA